MVVILKFDLLSPKKLPWSYWCVIGMAFKDAECSYPKIGRGRVEWPVNRFSALTDEKKRILGEIVGCHVDIEKPGWAKRKMWWGKKIHASLYFINFFLLSLSHVHHFVSPWTAAHQASLSSLFPRVCSFLLFFLLMEMLYPCPNKKKKVNMWVAIAQI